MIAPTKKSAPSDSVPEWQGQFLPMMPIIRRHAAIAFRDLSAEAKEEAVQEVTANALCAFWNLVQRGKADLAYPSVLARFAVAQYRDGRRVGNRNNGRDVYATQAQRQAGYRLKCIGSPREQHGGWREQLTDNRRTPVVDQVIFRLDFAEWLKCLPDRNRKMAMMLVAGERTGNVAKQFKLSAGRVSQLRGELRDNWLEFHGELPSTKTALAVA